MNYMEKRGRRAVVCIASIALVGMANAQNPTMDEAQAAAIRLKAAKVERTFDSCLKRGGTDDFCRRVLESIHTREKAALSTISEFAKHARANGSQLARELAQCTDPIHDYDSSIRCLSALAQRTQDALVGQTLVRQ